MKDREIFTAALAIADPGARAAFLAAACTDPESKARVLALLDAEPGLGSFLETPAFAHRSPELVELAGTIIGPYKLMEQIGEGGFALVFVAMQQEPVRRKVAIKMIKPGMDTRDVIARFEAERQALAVMDHPNISKVFDAGTTESGRPYFVMELVRGIPIVEYCDQEQLTARERLELFLSVCQAVQHAHGKGIIHRDLKPSNILVAPHDGLPLVKVIDFGIAKAIGQQLTDKTIYTRFAQMIGTPLYMSPEQAEINALDVDIRRDVYSLGVLLYELLTGMTPFDRQRFASAAYDEIRRIIREEEPPKPSTRLSTMGATLSAVSARRKTEPAKLSALVKGDLDWIVMKTLEKERNRRYETASAVAADVRRFMAQEPIEARPPSAGYRFGKMARRHRVLLTAVAFVAAALSPDGRSFAHSGTAGAIAIRDANDGTEFRVIKGLDHPVHRLTFSPDGSRLMGVGENGVLKIWNPGTGQELAAANLVDMFIDRIEYSPDGKRVAIAGNISRYMTGVVRILDAESAREVLSLEGHALSVNDVAFSPDQQRLATASLDHTVRLWDLGTGQEILKFRGHSASVTGIRFVSGGQRLLSVSCDRTIRTWDATSLPE